MPAHPGGPGVPPPTGPTQADLDRANRAAQEAANAANAATQAARQAASEAQANAQRLQQTQEDQGKLTQIYAKMREWNQATTDADRARIDGEIDGLRRQLHDQTITVVDLRQRPATPPPATPTSTTTTKDDPITSVVKDIAGSITRILKGEAK